MTAKSLMFLLLAAFLLDGCTSDSPDDLMADAPQGAITYTANVKSIIANNCQSCHSAPPVNFAPMPLTTYENVKDAILNRGLLDRISRNNGEEGLMPNGGPRMPQTNIEIINTWAANNFPE